MKAIDRLYKYLEYKDVKPTRFEKEIGLSNGYLGTQLKRKADLGESILNKIINYCLDINPEWLLTGNGAMLKKDKAKEYNIQEQNQMVSETQVSIYKLKTDYYGVDRQQIPLFEFDVAAGLATLFTNQAHQVPLDYITVPNAPKCDGAIFVRGDSMYPILKSGDIACYKTIHNLDNIHYGDMHILDLDIEGDQLLTVKYVQKSAMGEDYICLVSHNEHFAPRNIHKSKIRAIALVKLSIRYNTIA